MAEIKIEKKSPVWPWVLLILAVLAIVAYFVYADDDDDDYTDDENINAVDEKDNDSNYDSETYDATRSYSDTTNTMMSYRESIKDSTRIGTDTMYTKTALKNLAKVVTQKAEENNVQSSKSLEDLKEYTNFAHKNETSTTSPSTQKTDAATKENADFNEVIDDIVNVVETIQVKSYPSLQSDVAGLKETVNKMPTSTDLTEKQKIVNSFFKKVDKIINKMNT